MTGKTRLKTETDSRDGGLCFLHHLSPDLLCRLWPGVRVVAGTRVSKRVRQALVSNATQVVMRRRRDYVSATQSEDAVEDQVLGDLTRFQTASTLHLQLRFGAMISVNALLRASEAGRLCNALIYLDLSNNTLAVEGTKKLARILAKCGSVRSLSLRENKITAEAAGHLGAALQRSLNLEEIDLNGNELGDEGTISVSEGLMNCSSLVHVRLGRNKIGDVGAAALALLLHQCRSTLKTFDIHCNCVGDGGVRRLSAGLAQCYFLEHLDLSHSAFGEDGGKTLGRTLSHLKLLHTVRMRGTRVGEAGAAIARAVAGWKRLRELDFGGMALGEMGAAAIADALRGCRALETVHLDGNDFAGTGAVAWVALALAELPLLRSLRLLSGQDSISTGGVGGLGGVGASQREGKGVRGAVVPLREIEMIDRLPVMASA